LKKANAGLPQRRKDAKKAQRIFLFASLRLPTGKPGEEVSSSPQPTLKILLWKSASSQDW
jgi:hypothetical protein